MTKLLLIFGIFFGILYFFYYKFKQFISNVTNQFDPKSQQDQTQSVEQRVDKGKMAKCPTCGVYFPENTGVKKMISNGEIYCSPTCRDKK